MGSSNGSGFSLDLSGIQEELDNVEETMKKYEDLQKKIQDCFMAMILAASIASLLVAVFSKIEPWGAPAAMATAAAGTTAILASQIAAYAYLGQIAKLAKESGIDSIKPGGWDWTAPWLIGSLLAGCIWASWALAGFGSDKLVKFVTPVITSIGGSGIMKSLSHFFNRIGGKK